MAKPETCAACGQEVRWGWRHDREAYWHREDVDHPPIFGNALTPEQWEVTRRALAEARGEKADEEEASHEIEPIEVHARDVTIDEFPPRSGIRQVINLITKQGWELVSVRHARGPYMGARKSLGVSDVHVVKARGPVRLDGTTPVAVASWRDLDFDFAYIGVLPHLERVKSTDLKAWIKGKYAPDSREGDD